MLAGLKRAHVNARHQDDKSLSRNLHDTGFLKYSLRIAVLTQARTANSRKVCEDFKRLAAQFTSASMKNTQNMMLGLFMRSLMFLRSRYQIVFFTSLFSTEPTLFLHIKPHPRRHSKTTAQ